MGNMSNSFRTRFAWMGIPIRRVRRWNGGWGADYDPRMGIKAACRVFLGCADRMIQRPE